MSKEITKDEVILHKKASIKTLNRMLEYFINSSNPKHLKKANLLAYWIENYSEYILREEKYDPLKQLSYKRGDILKVNFGFKVGKEYGGLHYAIVIDKNNHHSSHVITVVPLTSGTKEETHEKDVYLGTELFSKLTEKHNNLVKKARKELDELEQLEIVFNDTIDLIQKALAKEIVECNGDINSKVSDELNNKYINLLEKKEERDKKYLEMQKDLESLEKNQKELDKMKPGSIALIGQITTIDKARIYIPRKSQDVLHGISFSEEKMNFINEALKAQYIF